MDTIKINNKSVRMIAHRGVSGLECENTNAAFAAAGNRSYYGIETDVHKTKDGKFVIIHDEDLKRVTNDLYDINVEKSNYEDFKDIILPDVDRSRIRTDLKIPTLSEYVYICKKYNKVAVCELKNEFEKDDILKITDIFKEYDYLENTVFITFFIKNCQYLREILPLQKIELLAHEYSDEVYNSLIKYNMGLDISKDVLTKEIVDKLHKKGLVVNCWTCNDKDEAEKLIEMGADEITTNILE